MTTEILALTFTNLSAFLWPFWPYNQFGSLMLAVTSGICIFISIVRTTECQQYSFFFFALFDFLRF